MDEQRTDEWFQARLGKITASAISNVMMKPTTAGYQNYMAQLICERLTGQPTETYQSAAMLHGIETEPQARALYEMETGLDVIEVGFVNHPSLMMAGASPDGLCGDDGLVEIKCPQSAQHIATLTGGSIKREYVLQMQWQMICTERQWCDFVSFCPSLPIEMQMFRKRIGLDAEVVEELTSAVTKFLAETDAKMARLCELYKKEAA